MIMSSLDDLRVQINDIDDNIIRLLIDRMNISIEVGKYKIENNIKVLDTGREKQVMERLINYKNSLSDENIDEGFIKELWTIIMNYSKELQKNLSV
jgi:monofunctional chorismate mutase